MRYLTKFLGVITTALVLTFPTFEGLRQGKNLQISPASAQNISYSQSPTQSKINNLLREGEQQYQNEEYEKALKTFQQVLKLRRNMDDLAAEGRALFYVGAIYEKLGQIEKAEDYYWEVVGVAEEISNYSEAETVKKYLCYTPGGEGYLLKKEKINTDEYCTGILWIGTGEGDSSSVTLLFDEDGKKK
ncbi:MAG: tetratricopeptide repeat protein [Microcoleaceae cyanobacterium MO_207.B10]|nr:tetratricopeptide repeat protein [Microcoleaceae cyanobacterium MO_207.B10]